MVLERSPRIRGAKLPQKPQRAEGPLRARRRGQAHVSAISEGEARAYCTVGLVTINNILY